MTDELFYKLWQDALDQPNKEMYINEYGYPEWFEEIGTDPEEIVKILGNIYDVAHMTVRNIVDKSGMSKAAFARHFCIPIRTLENWLSTSSGSKRACAPYIRLMLAKDLGYINIKTMEKEKTIMKKYELKKNMAEVKESGLKKGCTLFLKDTDPEVIKSFDNKKEALKALEDYKTEIENMGRYYHVTEYYVEEAIYEDDEWIDGGDIYGVSSFPEE